MLEHGLGYRKISRSILLVATMLLLLVSLRSAGASVYYYLSMESQATVSSPPVILQNGNVSGASTIYTNSTSAKVNVTAPIWLSGWDNRVKITIDHNDISSFTMYEFPMLVYLSSSSGRNNDDVTFVFDEVGSNRKKIAVTTDDGKTQCYVEIEKWDSSGEEAWLWVKVPSVSYTVDTVLYLYYDNDHADNTGYVGDPNSTPAGNVWGSTYKLVTHMLDDPDTSHIRDSTSNNNDGTKYGAGQPAVTTSGKIDDAQDFDGGDDYIDCGTGITDMTYHTITAWVNLDLSSGETYYAIVSTNAIASPYNGTELAVRRSDGAIGKYLAGSWRFSSTNKVTDDTWAFIAIRGYKHSSSGYLEISKDGSSWESIFTGNTGNLKIDSGTSTNIGRWAGDDHYTNGIVDEVRVISSGLSSNWIKAYYESERDDLIDFGQEDYVDNNTSNVDSSSPADKGTHSSFTAQQYGPDLVNDTLTEENTAPKSNTTLLNDGFEAADWDANWDAIAHNWQEDNSPVHSGSASAWATYGSSGYFTCDDLDASGVVAIYVDFWYYLSNTETNDLILYYYDGSAYDQISDIGDGTEGTWLHYTQKVTDSQYFKSNFRIRFDATPDLIAFEDVWVDDVLIKKETQGTNYELDLEVQWTSVDYDEATEYLCIYGGTMASENITVSAWNGSSWKTVFTDLSSGWNNGSVSSYLTSSTFTIRFKGSTETSDTTQSSWQIDATLLHVWASYDYVLKIVNQVASSWEVKLQAYSSSGLSRLLSTTISIRNTTTTSNQIIVSGGTITQTDGSFFVLPGGVSETLYIKMSNVKASTTGTSYIYTYLKIQKPNTTTYMLYHITFEIT